MNKYFLVFKPHFNIEMIHEHIFRQFDFPAHYGRNLDALHDCLTDIFEDSCVGIFYSVKARNYDYIKKIIRVFKDVEVEKEHIVFFASNIRDNVGFEDIEDFLTKREDFYSVEEEHLTGLRDVKLRKINTEDN